MRKGRGRDEVVLKARLGRRFDAGDDFLDLTACGSVEQSDARAGAARMAGRRDLGKIAIGDGAESP